MMPEPIFPTIETEDSMFQEGVLKMWIRPNQMMLRFSLMLAALAAIFVFTAPMAKAQGVASDQTSAKATTGSAQEAGAAKAVRETASMAKESKPAPGPVFKQYRGVEIGMKADEVRGKLKDYLKSKSDGEDFYLFSGGETATVYYDAEGKVTALSVDFPAKSTQAPSAKEVLGLDAEAKTDGSVYSLVRYPDAGYWVAYSRTAGDSALVTVTIQKMR